jgi:chromosome segregation ATPase
MHQVGSRTRVRTLEEIRAERGEGKVPSALEYWKDRATLAEGRIEALESEVATRYTAAQVGDFQASEAELVSAPLRRRIEELTADRNKETAARQAADQARQEMALAEVALKRQVRELRELCDARQNTIDSMSDDLGTLRDRVRETKQSLDARDRLLREATTKLREVAARVFHESVAESLVETKNWNTAGYHLADVIREIRGILGGSEGPYSPSVQVQP